VPYAASVFSSVRITEEQLAWLAELFGGKEATYIDGIYDTNPGTGGFLDGVGLTDGSDDIDSIDDGSCPPVHRSS
jgi:hypothetical protein